MGVQIPPVLVLIVCKTISAGAPDQNAAFTHWENLKWDTPNSMMVCRRNEIQLYDPVEGMKLNPGDDPAPPLNPNFSDAGQCQEPGSRSPPSGTRRIETRPGGSGASDARLPSSISEQEPLSGTSSLNAVIRTLWSARRIPLFRSPKRAYNRFRQRRI